MSEWSCFVDAGKSLVKLEDEVRKSMDPRDDGQTSREQDVPSTIDAAVADTSTDIDESTRKGARNSSLQKNVRYVVPFESSTNRKSFVWKYFEECTAYLTDGRTEQIVRCKLPACSHRELAYSQLNSSTSGMRSHLRRFHPNQYSVSTEAEHNNNNNQQNSKRKSRDEPSAETNNKRTKGRLEQAIVEVIATPPIKTEFSADFRAVLDEADDIKLCIDKLLNAFRVYIPSETRAPTSATAEKNRDASVVSNAMKFYAERIAKWPHDRCDRLQKVLEAGFVAFKEISVAEKDYTEQSAIHFTAPMKTFEQFVVADIKSLDQERKRLNTIRGEMDNLKNKASKNREVLAEAAKAATRFEEQQDKVRQSVIHLERKLATMELSIKHYLDVYAKHLQMNLDAVSKVRNLLS